MINSIIAQNTLVQEGKVHKLLYGKEIVGAYGEHAGVSCPHCGTRQRPEAEANTVVFCWNCQGAYRMPANSKSGLIKNQSAYLTKEQRERGLTLQVEKNEVAILFLDGKILKRWYRNDPPLTTERLQAEVDALFSEVC